MKKLISILVASLFAFPAISAVNVNTATQSQLEAIKGVGPAKAKAIIDYREANGGFKSLSDLDKVKGFGKATIDKLKDELIVETVVPKKK